MAYREVPDRRSDESLEQWYTRNGWTWPPKAGPYSEAEKCFSRSAAAPAAKEAGGEVLIRSATCMRGSRMHCTAVVEARMWLDGGAE